MVRRKNVKRIDPRYFLHETENRDEDLQQSIEETSVGGGDLPVDHQYRPGFGKDVKNWAQEKLSGVKLGGGIVTPGGPALPGGPRQTQSPREVEQDRYHARNQARRDAMHTPEIMALPVGLERIEAMKNALERHIADNETPVDWTTK